MKHALILGAQIVLGVVFAYAGAAKFAVPRPLADALISLASAPATTYRTVAVRVSRSSGLLEVVAAFLLLSGAAPRLGLLGAGALGAGIAAAASVALVRGVKVACGCFGETGGRPLGWAQLLSGLALAAAAATVAAGSPAGGPTGGAGPLAAASVLALLLVLLRNRSAVFRPLHQHFRPFATE